MTDTDKVMNPQHFESYPADRGRPKTEFLFSAEKEKVPKKHCIFSAEK